MPYTGIVLAILAVHLAAFLILIAHWLVSAGLFPRAAEKFADIYDQRPIRAFLLGLVTYGPIQVLGLNANNIHNGAVKLIVIIATFGSLLIAFIGTSGLALRIGRNLSAGSDTWHQVLRGGVMLALVFITPFLGWFFALPIGLVSGFGAFLLARPWKANVPAPATLPLPDALQVAPPLPVTTTGAPVAAPAPTLS
ncbi:MAG TPA: hypothetical protein VFD27_19965 [Chthoniobacteraceae bacterium]|jgi:hypothetical protein|nr:hypothetical protein [Chthoniobacteraceae bacterium]